MNQKHTYIVVKMPIISVEGSIGAGKTTFLKAAEKAGYRVVYEPVDKWNAEMIAGSSMFELYYKDKVKYGFAFQMYVLQSCVEHLLEVVRAHPNEVILTERSPITNCKVFAEMMYEQGIIDDYSFRVYKKWYDYVVVSLMPHIDGLVYIRVNPETCVQRILKRNRNGEERIDLNYLRGLHEKHERWMSEVTDTPVLIMDGNDNVPDVKLLTEFIGTI